MTSQLCNLDIYNTIHYGFPLIYGKFYLINEIKTLLGRLMAQINTLNDSGVIRDYFRNFHLSSAISLEELIFLFLNVMSML